MNAFWLLLLFSLQVTAASGSKISLNHAGFPVCAEVFSKTYFFEWDHISAAQNKSVFYYEMADYIQATGHYIHGCEDFRYLKSVPAEILKDISLAPLLIFDQVQFALAQAANGGTLFHAEKSADIYVANHPELFQLDKPEILTQLRREGGDSWAQNTIASWSDKIFNKMASCERFVGTCDFYLCQERLRPCGLQGYNLGFGYKYCSASKFKLADEMTTTAGKAWVQNVFKCLQKKNFEQSRELTNTNQCQQIQTNSIQSHPNCYVQAGFCQLKYFEKAKIINLIKNEIFSLDTLAQGLEIMNQCGDQQ